jgi:hypothetical protein
MNGPLTDQESFDWPGDLGHCLTLAIFRQHAKLRLSSREPEPETLADTNGADRWKRE